MTTTIERAARCRRCEVVGYRRRLVDLSAIPGAGRDSPFQLCPRCCSELGDLLAAFMRGER